MLKFAAIFFFVCSSYTIQANEFHFNQNCKNAYKSILSLRLNEGQSILEEEKVTNPNNLIPYYLENYIDFFTIFIGENATTFNELQENKEIRIKKILAGNKNSPFYLYTQAEIHIQWAFARLKFEEYISAAYELFSAYNLLEENSKKYPKFYPNQKSLALLHALIGAVPEKFNWIVELLGLKGNVDQGLNEFKELISNNENDEYEFLYKTESQVLATFLLLHLKRTDANEWNLVNLPDSDIKDNLLLTYVLATKAIKLHKNDEAIELLLKRPKGKEYYEFYFLDYLLGILKLRRLDDDSYLYFGRFINHYHGLNYIKASYQALAWYYLLKGNTEKYYKFIVNCKKKGFTFIDEDVQALKEAHRTTLPNVYLLKSRLLFDGGYYSKALLALGNITNIDKLIIEERIEITYREGRIYHEWGNFGKAKLNYEKTIEEAQNLPLYFAASASLNLGYIYEIKKDYPNARKYFNLCMKMKDHEYKKSLDYKAKVALDRIKGK